MTRMASSVASIQSASSVGLVQHAGRGRFQPKARGHPVDQRPPPAGGRARNSFRGV